ncbi:MAG: hypothetical protein AAGC72_13125 [Planctomycetota bacterium]
MNRTLNLIDQPGDTAEAAVLRLSADASRDEQEGASRQHAWLLFGGEATRNAARSVGLSDTQYRLLPMPVGMHRVIPKALDLPRRLLNQAHRVVCWTEGSTKIASLLGCAHAVRRVEDATLCLFAERVIRQARETPPPDLSSRQTLRESWGVDDSTTVVALLGDRFDQTDASEALMAVALTHEALRATRPGLADVRLLSHPMTKRRAEATEFSECLKLDRLLIQDAKVAMPWDVMPGCDAAVACRFDRAGLSMLWACSIGVPIVVPADRQHPMLDRLSGLIVARTSQPKDQADALTAWLQSRSTVPA